MLVIIDTSLQQISFTPLEKIDLSFAFKEKCKGIHKIFST